MSDTIVEGTNNGTPTQPTPEEQAAKVASDAAAKVVADKAAADAKLLDGNGNPKSAEVLAAEKAAADATAATSTETTKEQDDLNKGITTHAKEVEDLVVSAGVKPVDLISEANPQTGDISVAHKAKLIEKHGEAIANLIEGNIQKIISDTKKAVTAKDTAVYSQLEAEFKGVTEQSGKDTWKELSGWIKENTDSATRTEYNKMLSAGGMSAKLAVKAMVEAFKGGNDMTINADLLGGDDAPGGGGGGFITRQEYMVQLDALMGKGHDYDTSPEIATLNKKRQKSINMGR